MFSSLILLAFPSFIISVKPSLQAEGTCNVKIGNTLDVIIDDEEVKAYVVEKPFFDPKKEIVNS